MDARRVRKARSRICPARRHSAMERGAGGTAFRGIEERPAELPYRTPSQSSDDPDLLVCPACWTQTEPRSAVPQWVGSVPPLSVLMSLTQRRRLRSGEIIPDRRFNQGPRQNEGLLRDPDGKCVTINPIRALQPIADELSSDVVADQLNTARLGGFFGSGDDLVRGG